MKKTVYTAIVLSFIFGSTILISCEKAPEKEKTTTEEVITEETASEEVETEAISGQDLFTSNGCVACHQAETKTVAPLVKEIAEAYSDNSEGLNKFMNGENEAIVDPTQAAVMAPQIEITKKMTT